MFGGSGLGGALKNLGSKAEELFEKKKQEAAELAAQKKNMATELLQSQIKKTGELLTQGISDAEKLAVSAAEEAKHEAIDAFDAEVSKVEKAVDDGINQAAGAVDSKLKEADDFLDQKRNEVAGAVVNTAKQTEETVQDASAQLLGKARGLLSSVFPPLNLHDYDQVRIGTNDHDRQKKLLQSRGKSLELKEVLEKNKSVSGTSKSTEKAPNGKTDQQKTPTKSDKALLKLEQQQIKSEQKAQQKLEKEQHKLEKEHQKEQMKLEKELLKEQIRLEKEQKPQSKANPKCQEKGKASVDLFSSIKDNPQLKTQKSIDLSSLKHQKSIDIPKQPARKSVDMQYKQDLLNSADFASSFSSTQRDQQSINTQAQGKRIRKSQTDDRMFGKYSAAFLRLWKSRLYLTHGNRASSRLANDQGNMRNLRRTYGNFHTFATRINSGSQLLLGSSS